MGPERETHSLKRLIGSVKDGGEVAGLLQAVACADDAAHVSSPVRTRTRSIAAGQASSSGASGSVDRLSQRRPPGYPSLPDFAKWFRPHRSKLSWPRQDRLRR